MIMIACNGYLGRKQFTFPILRSGHTASHITEVPFKCWKCKGGHLLIGVLSSALISCTKVEVGDTLARSIVGGRNRKERDREEEGRGRRRKKKETTRGSRRPRKQSQNPTSGSPRLHTPTCC
jgi:hypothetical protein